MQTINSNFTVDANSATRQEIYDNCSVWIPNAIRDAQAGEQVQTRRGPMNQPYGVNVSWDNASIHRLEQFRDGLVGLGLSYGAYLMLPAKSPDLHHCIEHRFGQLKLHLVQQMYHVGWDNVTEAWVKQTVMDFCAGINGDSIRSDLDKMHKLYYAVSTPKGQSLIVDGKEIVGTGGYYTKKGLD